MKKAVLILLLGISVLFSAGSYFIYRISINAHRSAVRMQLRSDPDASGLVSLSILPSELYVNTSQLTWEDDNAEVIYKGSLYDVASVAFENGHVVLQLQSDLSETEMRDVFASVNDDAPGNHSPYKLLKQFLSLKFLPDAFFEFPSFEESSLSGFFSYTDNFTPAFLLTETLPPV